MGKLAVVVVVRSPVATTLQKLLLYSLLPPLFAGLALTVACGPSGGDDLDGGGSGGDAGTTQPRPDARPGAPDARPGDPDPVDGLGPWDGTDNVPPSQLPPFGVAPERAPMFVTIGWDDNGYSGLPGSAGTGGVTWALDMLASRTNPPGTGQAGTYDGSPVRMSFYLTSTYGETWYSESPTFVKRAWRAAKEAGHEIGNHTKMHSHGEAFSAAMWNSELSACNELLMKPFDPNEPDQSPNAANGIGMNGSELYGFRTPFLEYNDATFTTEEQLGFWYDCSIEDGYQPSHDGTNYYWPYTLDNGSPGHDLLVEWELKAFELTSHPGLWEMPVHPVIVPPDDKCADYGVPPGLRAKMKGYQSWFDEEGGKITGFDYNLWVLFKMTKAEFLATLEYTLDQRLAGNRAPFMFGSHTDYYSDKYTAPPNATPAERQEAIEEFVDYALSKPDVRIVSNKQILDWVRNPVPLQ